jgi:peptide/nickel transport system substrate-binding protein
MRWVFPAAVGAVATAGVVVLATWVLRLHPAPLAPDLAAAAPRLHPQGDLYVVPVAIEPGDLNPFTTTDGVARRFVLSYTHDSLLHVDPGTGALRPSIAAKIEPEANGLAWVLHLRPGVRFADGSPLEIEDVLFTWELARAGHALPGSMWTDLELIESLEPVGDGRLRLVLRQRYFAGLGLVATSYTVVQRRYFLEQVAERARAAGEPVPEPGAPAFARFLLEIDRSGPGTGPYRLAEDARTGELLWRPGVDLLLVRNEQAGHRSAHAGEFNLDGIKLVFTGDALAGRALLRERAIDWSEEDDASAVLQAEPDLSVDYAAHDYGYLTLGPVFVVWNHRHAALRDERVRRALTMLFDRDGLVQLRGRHRARPAATWFLPGTPRAGDLEPLPFDVDGARSLLEEAGYGASGAPLELTMLTVGASEYQEIVDLAVPAFARAGVALAKKVVDYAVLRERMDKGEFDGVVYAWNPDVFNDPTEIFHSTARRARRSGARRAVLGVQPATASRAADHPALPSAHQRLAAPSLSRRRSGCARAQSAALVGGARGSAASRATRGRRAALTGVTALTRACSGPPSAPASSCRLGTSPSRTRSRCCSRTCSGNGGGPSATSSGT